MFFTDRGIKMGLSIGDVEKITGISKDRLRYYEEKQLISPVRCADNSYREYDNEEVLKLLGIQLYRSMDLGVKEIQQIQDSDTIKGIYNVFKKRQKELQLLMDNNAKFKDDVQLQLQAKRDEMLTPLKKRLLSTVSEVCVELNLDYVVDTGKGTYLFINQEKGVDISDQVNTRLGIERRIEKVVEGGQPVLINEGNDIKE